MWGICLFIHIFVLIPTSSIWAVCLGWYVSRLRYSSDVGAREEGVAALDTSNGPVKTRSGLEPMGESK